MARYRTIKPQLCDDLKIGRISISARYLYICMWMFADDIGVLVGDTLWLKSKVFPYDQIQIQQFEKWMNELVINGFICLLSYKGERFIYLPNFTRHQVINRPNYCELNIPKRLIDSIKDQFTDQSLNVHGSFTEQSVTIIREEEEKEYTPPIAPPGDESSGGNNPETLDYKKIADTFNEMFAHKLPKVTALTEKRKRAVKARLAEHGAESVQEVFRHVLASDFLLGRNSHNWRCDFDWIFRPTNYIKILEGNYENGENTSKHRADSERRKMESAIALATTVREAAEKRRAELEAGGPAGEVP